MKEHNADIDPDQDRYPTAGAPWRGLYGMGIGLATLRLDGFASVGASYDGGEITSVAFTVAAGQQLQINAKCDFGEILVELLPQAAPGSAAAVVSGVGDDRYADAAPLAGYSVEECEAVQADGVALRVGWAGGRCELPSSGTAAFRIRFRLRNALLYSYCVVPV